MKKFTVFEVLRHFSPNFKESFKEKDDAIAFAQLLKRTNPERDYAVLEVIEEL